MGLEKYISDVVTLDWDQHVVYEKLSTFKTFEALFSPENIEKVKSQVKDAPDFKIEDFEATDDTCSFKVGSMGRTGLQIVNREPSKEIKMTGNGTVPFKFTFWIQVLPVTSTTSKVRLTVHADMNMMMKMMVGKKLKSGINQLANGLQQIPFGNL
ncbi:hypothetical protein K5X82_14730 [Halosquirtibacter xylanolyticus]|uniref:SRPBCC domain-containing protein n=1 Tax=Halosquirtibacter xylanolyticus TaxID=3374599 RepID=UPI00374A56E6|nr:hypothetical protein K5X82_14730 [Prolixibacteraceae bacterium]